jgi:hypothetical protein
MSLRKRMHQIQACKPSRKASRRRLQFRLQAAKNLPSSLCRKKLQFKMKPARRSKMPSRIHLRWKRTRRRMHLLIQSRQMHQLRFLVTRMLKMKVPEMVLMVAPKSSLHHHQRTKVAQT